MPAKKQIARNVQKKKIIMSDSSSESDWETVSSEVEESATSSSNIYSENDTEEYSSPSSPSLSSASDKKRKKSSPKKSGPAKPKSSAPSKFADADNSDDGDDESSDDRKRRHTKRRTSRRKEAEESEASDSVTLNSDDDDDDDDLSTSLKEQRKFNIIVNIDNNNPHGDYGDDSDVESLEEDVTEEVNSEDEKTFMRETYHEVCVAAEEPAAAAATSSPLNNNINKKQQPAQFEEEYQGAVELKKVLLQQLKQLPNSKLVQKSLAECKTTIAKLVRKARFSNTNAYYKMLNTERSQTNEIDYFKHRLSNQEQKHVLSHLNEINREIFVDKPFRLRLLQCPMPIKFKAVAMQRLNMLDTMDSSDNEYFKIKNWIDNFMRIPFGVYKNIEVRREDGIECTNAFMQNAKSTLDACVYGLNDAKMQIMQMLGQWIVNPSAMGTAIAIHGPPGTGKTSLVKDGISKILGREFAFIALGGCGDGSFLEGHSYTYEGSVWGRIVQILMESKCMNPVIYFDELDKVSDTPRGQEIIGILTHLTDTSQNSEFHDKYFSEVSFDLSKCLFIFSYNDESAVNPILKDRMYRIQTKGYETADKIVIAKKHLLPKIREQVNFTEEEVVFPDETLRYIVTTPHLTKNESGVRNLKRCLEVIYTKLNLYRLVSPDNPLFEKDMGVKVEFPITVTRKEVDQFIKNNETVNPSLLAMYV